MNESGPSRDFLDENCRHRPNKRSFGSSSEESADDNPFKRRKERRRSNTSKGFTETLSKAKTQTFACEKLNEEKNSISLRLTTTGGVSFNVDISETPSCTCSFFSNPRKTKQTCVHIVWVLIKKFSINESNALLAQVQLTKVEVASILAKSQPVSSNPSSSTTTNAENTFNASLTDAEILSVFEAKKVIEQLWIVEKVTKRMTSRCCSCKSTMPEGKLYLKVNGYYIPINQTFAVERSFFFCTLKQCVSKKPFMSNIVVPPKKITLSENLCQEDIDIICRRGFTFN